MREMNNKLMGEIEQLNRKVEKLSSGGEVTFRKMTTVERDAIASPTAGMVIYNTTTNVLNFYNGVSWGAV